LCSIRSRPRRFESIHRALADHLLHTVPDSATKHLILDITAYAALVVGGLVLLWWAVFIARKPRRFCPGVPRPCAAWLWPFTLVTLPQCGYDLTSLRAESGVTRCPECGRQSRGRQRRRTTGTFAHLRVGLPFLLLGLFIPTALAIRSGRWASYIPDTGVLAIRATLGPWTPKCVRAQLLQRTDMTPVDYSVVPQPPLTMSYSPWQQRWAARLLVSDFVSDSVSNNAEGALWTLSRFDDRITIPLVERALNSEDYQQRQFAAEFLRQRPNYPATDALIRVTVEGLKDDQFPYSGGYTYLSNAREGWGYLLTRMDAAETEVALAMNGEDRQQRFLCAGLIAATRRAPHLERACSILIAALGDNRQRDDAAFASSAITCLGPQALGYLDPATHGNDPQRRKLAGQLAAWIRKVDLPSKRALRAHAADIFSAFDDPPFLRGDMMYYRIPHFSPVGDGSRAPTP
jgi:hypothetical protein